MKNQISKKRWILMLSFTLCVFYYQHKIGLYEWNSFLNNNPRRHHWMHQFLQSYQDTGQLFLFKPPKADYVPMELLGDDEGLYLLSAGIQNLGLGLSELHIHWILGVLPALCYLLLLLPCAYRSSRKIAAAFAVLTGTFISITTLDVYGFVILPSGLFLFYLVNEEQLSVKLQCSYLATFGVLASLSEEIRSHTGLIFTLFLILFLLAQRKRKQVLQVILLLLSYGLTSKLYSHQVESWKAERDRWLQSYNDGNYTQHIEGGTLTSHALWHNIYLGLGYDSINGIVYHDSYAGMILGKTMIGQAIIGGFYPYDDKSDSKLKALYFETVRANPFKTLWMYSKKFFHGFCLILILGGLLLEPDGGKRSFFKGKDRLKYWLTASVCIVLLAPGVLAWPYPIFITGSLTTAPGILLLEKASE